MNILIERRRYSHDEYEVVAYDRDGRYARAYTLGDNGHLVGHVIDDGAELPVLMRVHRDFFEALLRASGDIVPAGDATTSHLRDAVTVRDRLLTLVEEGWHP